MPLCGKERVPIRAAGGAVVKKQVDTALTGGGALHSVFMQAALDEARAAALLGEVPVGAVIVREGEIIARAGNRTRTQNDPTAHAEMLVIRAAAAKIGSPRLVDCDLHVTLEPCAMCAGGISHARVRRLYYGASDPKGGAVEHGPRVFSQPTCFHAPEIYPGFGADDASTLLSGFFERLRER
jgi:tRNA(adenine34) deaminase